MENVANNNAASEVLNLALSKANYWKNPSDQDEILKVADALGSLSREVYFAVLAQWKSQYAEISKDSRATKPLRKGNNFQAMNTCFTLRYKARKYMMVRGALKALARRHAEQRKLEMAA